MRIPLGSVVVVGALSLGVAACGAQVAPDPDPVGSQPAAVDGDSHGSGNGPGYSGANDGPTTGAGVAPPPAPPPSSPFVAPTPFPWVASCPPAPVDAWTPAAAPTGTLDDFHVYADAVRASFVGHWKGMQSVFGTTPPVAFSFEGNGHYSGICLEAACWATIFNGSDNESPYKKYKLDAMNLDGVSSGLIDLAFPRQASMGENPLDPPYISVSGTTVLQKVLLDASGNRLRFDLVDYNYAPPYVAHYDLYRCE